MQNKIGASEWLLALACSVLIASETQTQGERQRLQSAVSYYFDSPFAQTFHNIGLAISIAAIATVILWLLTKCRHARSTTLAVALLGLVVCWLEIVYAFRAQESSFYVLRDLPFRPINNLGAIGAQVFGSYLIFKLPVGKMTGWRAFIARAGLAVAFWFFQAVVWQMLSR